MPTKDDTRITLTFMVMKDMLNPLGLLHGGEMVKMMDTAAALSCSKVMDGHVLTVAINSFHFHASVRHDEFVEMHAVIDYTGTTSMEVYTKAYRSSDHKVAATGYFTMVAVDKNWKPKQAPQLEYVNKKDQYYYKKAKKRKEIYRTIDDDKA